MALRLITAPTTEPLTLAEVKAHLRVDHANDDLPIALIQQAMREQIDGRDGWLNRALVTQVWELVLDKFPVHEIKIPLPPLISLDSIKYDDTAGVETTLAASEYTVDTYSQPGWVVPANDGWPATFDGVNAVRIRFTCGYGAAADVPALIKAWMLLNIGTLYENREMVAAARSNSSHAFVTLPDHIFHMLISFRVP